MLLPIATHYGMSSFVLFGSVILVPIALVGLVAASFRLTGVVVLTGAITVVSWVAPFQSLDGEDLSWSIGYLLVSGGQLCAMNWISAGRPGRLVPLIFPVRWLARRDNVLVLLFTLQAIGAHIFFLILRLTR